MPMTDYLHSAWYDTPNIHLCTIADFVDLCDDIGAKVERAVALNASGSKLGLSMPAVRAASSPSRPASHSPRPGLARQQEYRLLAEQILREQRH